MGFCLYEKTCSRTKKEVSPWPPLAVYVNGVDGFFSIWNTFTNQKGGSPLATSCVLCRWSRWVFVYMKHVHKLKRRFAHGHLLHNYFRYLRRAMCCPNNRSVCHWCWPYCSGCWSHLEFKRVALCRLAKTLWYVFLEASLSERFIADRWLGLIQVECCDICCIVLLRVNPTIYCSPAICTQMSLFPNIWQCFSVCAEMCLMTM